MRMIIERLSLYVAHTNLDAAPGGLGDWVAEVCGLHSVQPLILVMSEYRRRDSDGSEIWRRLWISRSLPLGFVDNLR